MLTSNYQAHYGQSAGAQISMVSKSGTQEFHGSAYEYYCDAFREPFQDSGKQINSYVGNMRF